MEVFMLIFQEIHCPVCGYYCLGKGGIGCIDNTRPSKLHPMNEKIELSDERENYALDIELKESK